jgi:hypothetical protein
MSALTRDDFALLMIKRPGSQGVVQVLSAVVVFAWYFLRYQTSNVE